ncbi:MAG: hypothetical protein H2212_07100 [Ruminococcus sp.]|nr:hypothetical protein [Ruminococcus sp.]
MRKNSGGCMAIILFLLVIGFIANYWNYILFFMCVFCIIAGIYGIHKQKLFQTKNPTDNSDEEYKNTNPQPKPDIDVDSFARSCVAYVERKEAMDEYEKYYNLHADIHIVQKSKPDSTNQTKVAKHSESTNEVTASKS